jgi:WD40 repeat protein
VSDQPPAPRALPFISYSRVDRAFVKRLAAALEAAGRDPWVDLEDIPPSVDWNERIRRAILEKDAVVFVLTESSASSRRCREEVDLAVEAGKRIVPIRLDSVPSDHVPDEIKKRNYFEFDQSDFEGSVARLIEVLDADYEWLRQHTNLQVRATDWVASGRKGFRALSGRDLEDAELWLGQARAHPERSVTTIQAEFIVGSRHRQTSIFRRVLAIAAGVSVVFIVLGLVALYQRSVAIDQRQVATARQLAAQAETLGDQYDLGLLLAVEADRLSNRPDVYASLLRTVAANEPIETYLHHGPGHDVYSVAFSPDASHLATGSLDGTISLWDRATRARTSAVHGHEGVVRSVAFAADGPLVTGGDDGYVRFWSVEDGQLRSQAEKPAHREAVTAVAVEHDGRLAASGSLDGTVLLWDLDTLEPRQPLPVDSAVTSLAFSPDGSTIAIGTDAGDIRLIDLANRREPVRLTGHDGSVLSVAFSPDGNMLASGGADRTVRRWSLLTERRIGSEMLGHQNEVTSVAFDPDGLVIASGSWDQTIGLWSAGDGTLVGRDLHHTGRVTSLSYATDRTLATGGTDGNVVLVNRLNGPRIATMLTDEAADIGSLVVSPDGRQLAAAGDTNLTTWDLTTDSQVGGVIPITSRSVAFSPDSSAVLVPASGNLERIRPDGSRTMVPIDDGDPAKVKVSGDGSRAVAIQGASLLWFDAATGAQLHGVASDDVSNDRIDSLTPDASSVITSDEQDGTLSIWSSASSGRVGDQIVDPAGLVKTAISPDGSRFVVYRDNATIEVYDTRTRRRVGAGLVGHQKGILSAAFSSDGRLLATGDDGGNLILWDRVSGVRIAGPLAGHVAGVDALAFTPSGDRLFSAGQDGQLVSWALGRAKLEDLACQTANRSMTTEEWDRFVGSTPYRRTCPSVP